MSDKPRILAAMSGGVDSSVTAALLKDAGYDVTGVTMSLWDSAALSAKQCCGTSEAAMAKAVCARIGIPHYVLDMREDFRKYVIDDFVAEYRRGRTPNPCIQCNRWLKFDVLFKKAASLGLDAVATGHYSTIEKIGDRYRLISIPDNLKDQSYFLYPIREADLSRILFPLGKMEKDKVRALAEKFDLPAAKKAESQDICFVDGKYGAFLEEYGGIEAAPGDILFEGKVVGRHKGLHNYTIGQRRGIGVALNKHVYVKNIDIDKNILILSDEDELFTSEFRVSDINVLAPDLWQDGGDYLVKVRYRTEGKECTVVLYGDGIVTVKLGEKERGVTPGQSAVFYRDDVVIAGGVIEAV